MAPVAVLPWPAGPPLPQPASSPSPVTAHATYRAIPDAISGRRQEIDFESGAGEVSKRVSPFARRHRTCRAVAAAATAPFVGWYSRVAEVGNQTAAAA
jgi:hypothetical protein